MGFSILKQVDGKTNLFDTLKSIFKKEPSSRSYRYLARKIELDFKKSEKACTLMLTSPESIEIISETVLMLAYIINIELGYKVLMVDATYRHEGVGSKLNPNGVNRIEDYLKGRVTDIPSLIYRTKYDHISVITAGIKDSDFPITKNSLKAIFEKAAADFDFILIQGGSIYQDSRYLVYPEFADSVLLLAENDKTLVNDIKKCKKLLRGHQAENVDIVLSI